MTRTIEEERAWLLAAANAVGKLANALSEKAQIEPDYDKAQDLWNRAAAADRHYDNLMEQYRELRK